MSTSTYIDEDGIEHALACLDEHKGDCSGAVEMLPTYRIRYTRNGDVVLFPRCERHFDAYWQREGEREHAAKRANRCEHGTYIGDPYICERCEYGE